MEPRRDRQFVRQLNDAFLQCRSIRHAWELSFFRAVEGDEAYRVSSTTYKQAIKRQMRCMRCDAVRTDYFGRADLRKLNGFEKVSTSYHYEKGYMFNKKESDSNAPMASDYNFELYRRMTESHE